MPKKSVKEEPNTVELMNSLAFQIWKQFAFEMPPNEQFHFGHAPQPSIHYPLHYEYLHLDYLKDLTV